MLITSLNKYKTLLILAAICGFFLLMFALLILVGRQAVKPTPTVLSSSVITPTLTIETATSTLATETATPTLATETATPTLVIEIPTHIATLDTQPKAEPTRGCDEPYLDWQKYVVHSGDNFDRLMDFQPKNIGEEAILSVNYCIKDRSFIQVGQILWFPNLPSTPSPTPVFSSTPTSPPLVTTPPSVSTPTVADPVPTPTPTEKPQPPTPEP